MSAHKRRPPKPIVDTVLQEAFALYSFGSRMFQYVFPIRRNLIVVSDPYTSPRLSIEYFNPEKERPLIDAPDSLELMAVVAVGHPKSAAGEGSRKPLSELMEAN